MVRNGGQRESTLARCSGVITLHAEELIPQPGEDLMTVAHERMARRVVEYRLRNKDREKSREAQEKHMEEEAEQQRRAAEEAEMEEEEEVEEEEDEGPKIPALTVVLRADAIGTVEAIMQAIEGAAPLFCQGTWRNGREPLSHNVLRAAARERQGEHCS